MSLDDLDGLFGGRADHFGNEFERDWVVSLALRVLHGDLRSINWQPLVGGEGIDVSLVGTDGTRSVHQCKSRCGTSAHWTVKRLREHGVVEALRHQVADLGVNEFVFVSLFPAPVLAELSRRARTCNNDPVAFRDYALTADEYRDGFSDLLDAWNLDRESYADLYQLLRILQCFRFATGHDDVGRHDLKLRASGLVNGPGETVFALIASYLFDRLGNDVYADQIGAHLNKLGYAPIDLAHVPTLHAAIERLNGRFEESVGHFLIEEKLIGRAEGQRVVEALDTEDSAGLIVVHGDAGSGKSGLLLGLIRQLKERGTPHLVLRLDSEIRGSLDSFSRESLDLPASPTRCLAAMAGPRRSVLLIDQVDAVRWTSSHAVDAWNVCNEIVLAALAVPTMRVVLACRTFDLDDDPRLKRLVSGRPGTSIPAARSIALGAFAATDAAAIFNKQGGEWGGLPEGHKKLLGSPLNLHLWCSLAKSGHAPTSLSSRSELLRLFFGMISDRITGEHHLGLADLDSLLTAITVHMDEGGVLTAPPVLTEPWAPVVRALCSLAVLRVEAGNRIGFAHQSFLDYLIARRVVAQMFSGAIEPTDWLAQGDQALFRRDQIRHVLGLLRENDEQRYLRALNGILCDPRVRFHLKHAVLHALASSATGLHGEATLVDRLLDTDEWRRDILWHVLAQSPVQFERVVANGVVQSWLRSADQQRRFEGRRLCRAFVERAGPTVERALLGAFGDDEPELLRVAADVLARDPAADSSQFFEWRLRTTEEGMGHSSVYQIPELAKRDPERSIRLLRAWLTYTLRLVTSDALGDESRERRERALREDHDFLPGPKIDAVRSACIASPAEAWRDLFPLMRGAITHRHRLRRAARRYDWDALSRRRLLSKYIRFLTRLLVEPGTLLLEPTGSLWRGLRRLSPKRYRRLNHLVARMLIRSGDKWADQAIEWILRDHEHRFLLQPRRTSVLCVTARSLIRRFAPLCGDQQYGRLEGAILAFHPFRERRSIRNRRSDVMSQAMRDTRPNRYGEYQNALLSVLPIDRMTPAARRAREAYASKFGPVTHGEPLMAGGWVGSPIPRDRLHLVSDRQWRRIIRTDWGGRPGAGRWRAGGRDRLLEASHATFANDFEQMAKRSPERFGQLVLRLPHAIPSPYLAGLLRALAETRRPSDLPGDVAWSPAKWETCEKVVGRLPDPDDTELARWVCALVRNRSDEAVSLAMMDRVAAYAVGHGDPADGAFAVGRERKDAQERTSEPDVIASALNCVRGGAAYAIVEVLFARPQIFERYQGTIQHLASDSHVAVRVAAQRLCLPVSNIDRRRALDLLLATIDGQDDRVLCSPDIVRIANHLWDVDETRLESLLLRMANSPIEEAAERGTYCLTVGAELKGLYKNNVEQYWHGTEQQRKGVVTALSAIAKQVPDKRERCLESLATFFDDPSRQVRQVAATILIQEGILSNPMAPWLVERLAESRSLQERGESFLYFLADYSGTLRPFGRSLLRIAQRLQGDLHEPARDISTGFYLVGDSLSKLLLRLYGEINARQEREEHAQCLDALDALLRADVGNIHDALGRMDC